MVMEILHMEVRTSFVNQVVESGLSVIDTCTVAGASDVTSVPGGAARIHHDVKGEAELLTRCGK